MLRNAFVFFSVGRYDVKGKQLLKTLGKNYIIDMGFRNMLLGYRDADRGHIIENIVFLELLRRDYRVYIGKVGETEVDFVAEKPSDKLYIQVTESMQAPETRERELRPGWKWTALKLGSCIRITLSPTDFSRAQKAIL